MESPRQFNIKRHERLTQTLRGTVELEIRKEKGPFYGMSLEWSESREGLKTMQGMAEEGG